jgi:hypothetical protein
MGLERLGMGLGSRLVGAWLVGSRLGLGLGTVLGLATVLV